MKIIRVATRTNYFAMSNQTARDKRLSLDALGLLTYLLSHSDRFEITSKTLKERFKIGRDKMRSLKQELEACGYLVCTARRSEDNTGFNGWEWTVFAEAQNDVSSDSLKIRQSENQTVRKSVTDKKKTEVLKKTEEKKEEKKEENVADATSRGSFAFQCEAIFDHWKEKMNSSRSILTPERRRLIVARLKEGYTVEQLTTAIDGNASSAWHQGENDRATKFNSLELILRNGTKVEHFIALKEQQDGRRNTKHDQSAFSTSSDARARRVDELIADAQRFTSPVLN